MKSLELFLESMEYHLIILVCENCIIYQLSSLNLNSVEEFSDVNQNQY